MIYSAGAWIGFSESSRRGEHLAIRLMIDEETQGRNLMYQSRDKLMDALCQTIDERTFDVRVYKKKPLRGGPSCGCTNVSNHEKEQSKHVSVKTVPGKITMEIYNPESTVTYHEVLTDVNVVWILDGLLKDIASDTIKTMHSSMYDEHTYNTSIKPVFIQALFRAMQIVIEKSGCNQELNPAILKDEKFLERFLDGDL